MSMDDSIFNEFKKYEPNFESLSNALKELSEVTKIAQNNIDLSGLQVSTPWVVQASDLLKVNVHETVPSGIADLLTMEQNTSRLLIAANAYTYTFEPTLTSVATQIESITESYKILENGLRSVAAPLSYIEDLKNLAFRQHELIQQAGAVSQWRLDLIDAASRFVDCQVTWANELYDELKGKIVDDSEQEIQVIPKTSYSPVSLIPKYVGYTNRKDIDITPEEGLERSVITEITDKGKLIIKNAIAINRLCEAGGKAPVFKYTEKMVLVSCDIGGTVCTADYIFEKIVDGLYMLFYENIKHIKSISSDDAVRKEEVYQCIFRVKNIRTDFHHDWEHGKVKDIDKKKRDIVDSYIHYADKPVLTTERDYVSVQNLLYDEFLKLEEHLTEILIENENMRPRDVD